MTDLASRTVDEFLHWKARALKAEAALVDVIMATGYSPRVDPVSDQMRAEIAKATVRTTPHVTARNYAQHYALSLSDRANLNPADTQDAPATPSTFAPAAPHSQAKG